LVGLKKQSAIRNNNAVSECPEWKQLEVVDLSRSGLTSSLWGHFDCVRDNGLLGIRGSLNLGNTCYLSAILQCFVHNELLRNHYLSGVHSNRCALGTKSMGCVSCEVEELFSDFYCGLSNAPVAITKLIGTIWQCPQYQLNNQMMHDSHELFISLIALLCRTSMGRSDDERSCECIVHSTFRGLWCSELKCTKSQCQHVSSTLDTFMEINLQFQRKEESQRKDDDPSQSIEDALNHYMESEPMPDYKCSRCGEQQCTKDMTIHTLPQTLCLHLKRFEADEAMKELSASAKATATQSRSTSPNVTTRNTRSRRSSHNGTGRGDANNGNGSGQSGNGTANNGGSNGGYQKMEEQVRFPVDSVLDLSQFVNAQRKSARVNIKEYRLKSMIIHSGDMHSGHYVSYIRKEKKWYYCDDHKIIQSSTDYVQRGKAYMLFYEAQ